MSLSTATRLVQYTLSGSGQPLTVSFKFFAASDLVVVKTVAGVDTTLTINTDYTVSGGGTPAATGTVTMVAGTAGDVMTIYGAEPYTQGADLTNNGPFPAVTLTAMVDRLTILVQQTRLDIGRSLRIPKTNAVTATPEMTLANRASALIAFNSSGDLDFTFGATYYADVLAAAAAAATSATAAASSATAAVGSASAASTSATSAASSASAASTSATASATSATAAASSATSATSSASAASTSATNAATSATASATSATAAASSASSASTSATSAAAHDSSSAAHDASSAAHDASAAAYDASAAASAAAAAGYVVPSQTGQAGKFLGTNGSVTAWYSSTLAANLLTGTTLATNIVTSSLTAVGALVTGSIASGFGTINVGANAVTGGAANFTTGAFSGAFSVNVAGGIIASYGTGGTAATSTDVVINGQNAAGWGPRLFFQSNSSNKLGIGLARAFVGSGSGNDAAIYSVSDNVAIYANSTLSATCTSTGITATTFTGALTGNASTATVLANARTINGVSFNGSGNIGQDLQTSASPTWQEVKSNSWFTVPTGGSQGIRDVAGTGFLYLSDGSNNTNLASAGGIYLDPAGSAGFTVRDSTSGYAARFSISRAGAATFAGAVSGITTLTSSAPAGASAGAWKLGSLVTGLTLTANLTQAVYIDIGGTVYKLLTGT